MRYMTAGDSHGEALIGIVEGFPAGHRLSVPAIERDLARRRNAYGRSARQKLESDTVQILSGIWKNKTTGAPIAISIPNSGRRVSGKSGGALGSVPRPGHADLAGCLKYGFDEVPPISERASARETAMRVAIGSMAKQILKLFAVDVVGHVVSLGSIDADPPTDPPGKLKRRVARSPLYCADAAASKEMETVIRRAKKEGYSLGGAVEVIATGVIPGLGSHTVWDRKLDSRLAAALMSIQSAKGVVFGDGLEMSRRRGHESHDEITLKKGRISRATNHAGGIEGGISNGEDIVIRLYAKPVPTSVKRLESFNMKTLKSRPSPFVRSDVCVIPALSVIAENVAAWELLEQLIGKIGGDTIDQMKNNFDLYRRELAKRGHR